MPELDPATYALRKNALVGLLEIWPGLDIVQLHEAVVPSLDIDTLIKMLDELMEAHLVRSEKVGIWNVFFARVERAQVKKVQDA